MSRISVENILAKKKKKQKITMLTAYDFPMAGLLDAAGIDIVLVGDSLANVVLGLNETRDVTMDAMIHHAKAVSRAVKKAMVVGDMPYEAYQKNISNAVTNAKKFITAGCDAVKLEWFDRCLEVARNIIKSGIPVMGHVGLTPQTAKELGGLKVQGKDVESAKQIIQNAVALEKAGCFSIVLECIPKELAQVITKKLKIPTIGIGAGVNCDGQVLVVHDLLGLDERFHPKFVKQYANLSAIIQKAVESYRDDVLSGRFPDKTYSFSMNTEELKKLQKDL